MPRAVSETTTGTQFEFSREERAIAASQTRTFKIVLSQAGELINVASVCGVRVGDQHPNSPGLYCMSFSAQYDGQSRMVVVATFNYRALPGPEERDQQNPPDVRPANWSISSSLAEFPCTSWKPMGDAPGSERGLQAPANAVGDLYDGITVLEPIVTITIDQFEFNDPTRHAELAGVINQNAFSLGTLNCPVHTVMFRGVQARPTNEQYGDILYRGWTATYEFMYRRNRTTISTVLNDGGWPGQTTDEDIGWDVAIPHTGFNVIAQSPDVAHFWEDEYAVPLKIDDDFKFVEPLARRDGIMPGQKVRAMILVGESNGKDPQRPATQPVALTRIGRALKVLEDDGDLVYPPQVYRYQVQPEYDFALFNLRLF